MIYYIDMKDIKIHPDLQMRRIKNAETKCREATSDWGKNHWYNTFKALCEKYNKMEYFRRTIN